MTNLDTGSSQTVGMGRRFRNLRFRFEAEAWIADHKVGVGICQIGIL
jgi:hypothetical protein